MGERGRMLQSPRELHRAVGVLRCSLGITQHPRHDRPERMGTHRRIVSHVVEGVMSMPPLVVKSEALLDMFVGCRKVAAVHGCWPGSMVRLEQKIGVVQGISDPEQLLDRLPRLPEFAAGIVESP